MKTKILVTVLFCIMSVVSNAQSKTHKHKHSSKHKTVVVDKPLPTWAKAHDYDAKTHVYFPDYYTFYDASRGGYVFWKDSQWSFTPTMPPFLEHVDMSKERVQILKGLDLDLHPERNYPNYVKMYPAIHDNDKVPVPRY